MDIPDVARKIHEKFIKKKVKTLLIDNFPRQHKTKNYLDRNYNIFQTTRFNHTMIFFKLIH